MNGAGRGKLLARFWSRGTLTGSFSPPCSGTSVGSICYGAAAGALSRARFKSEPRWLV